MIASQTLRPYGAGRFVLFCDHASNDIPRELHHLGLTAAERAQHIAWDIGAAGVTSALSKILDAPAILCNTSRLVIDCNRQLNLADLIPEISDGTVILGNLNLSESDKRVRIARWFHPYHNAIESVLMDRQARGLQSILVSIHSMTAVLAGEPRPWHISISSHIDRSFAEPVLAALREPGDIMVGDNQPYDVNPKKDYSIPFHALRRSLPHIQVEFRQNEILDATTQYRWALRFSQVLMCS